MLIHMFSLVFKAFSTIADSTTAFTTTQAHPDEHKSEHGKPSADYQHILIDESKNNG